MEKLILDIAKRGYQVTFTANRQTKTVTISVMPTLTGLGSSTTIDENANYCDALKALEIHLFQ